jgi:short-subunit dehydrogenase
MAHVRLAGACALVTGATGGLGAAIARSLHAAGAALVLTGRQTTVLHELAEELDARAEVTDLADRSALDRLVSEAGQVDVLVANAALPADSTLDQYTVEQIDRALDVNLRAPIVLAHALLPRMVEHGSGHLVFVSSIAGKAAPPGSSLYSATKFGLRGFAASLRQDLHGTGVGVSTIFPGFIRDAGMFPADEVKLPPGTGTSTSTEVGAAVRRAIERDRAEITVAPLPLRAAVSVGSLAPTLAARVQRRLGAAEIARRVADAESHRARR